MAENGELKKFNAKASGRSSILSGAKYKRGFTINPQQVLELFHRTQPGIPLPEDAKFKGLGVEDAGVDSQIQFYFTSISNPSVHCFAMNPQKFFSLLVHLADGLLPLDSELDGIEISKAFTIVMLRVSSSHWPAPIGNVLPLYHLRYDLGRLVLVDPNNPENPERKIIIQ